ncbi:putative BRISC and BRCA1-A complex member 1-like protein [Naja naja]|nr:putative BRISC and BRCA1-A complex member 1-like protein [Naja naja]
MDTSETNSMTEEEEEKLAAEQRPRTRSNPEGAEDRTLSMQASVGSRSEGEGEAASTTTSPPSAAVQAPNGKTWLAPTPPSEFQIICLDLSEEMSHPRLESFNGLKTNALNISQKMIEMFVRTKHKIDKSHEFALVVLSGFTSEPREVCSCLYDLKTTLCKSFSILSQGGGGWGQEDWAGHGEGQQQKTELPVTENIQTIPPPYVVRTILVYSRPVCQPPVVVTDQMKKMLQCPYFFFDVLSDGLGRGLQLVDFNSQHSPQRAVEETFAAFSHLDAKGTNYKYEVALSGPAVELHNCMAKLLAHPLQRPFQTHTSYSMLEEEEEEAPEMEAVV